MSLERARDAIRAQLVERDAMFPHAAPAYPWTHLTAALRYVFDLPMEHLSRIRLHADLIIGLHLGHHLLVLPNTDGKTYARDASYDWLGDGVPDSLWVGEPEVPGLPDMKLGALHRGRVINEITVNNQQHVCNLLRLGIREIPDRVIFVEVGAGYGSLALHVSRMLPSCTYVIADLPETLIFSAAYLLTHSPTARAYVYLPGDDLEAVMRSALDYDFIFIPNYRAPALNALPYVSVGYNSVSFPEMGRDAMREYLHAIAPKLRQFFFSFNNRGVREVGGKGVDDVLSEYFALTPSASEYRNGLRISQVQYDHLLCRPVFIGTVNEEQRRRLAGKQLREVSPLLGRVTADIGTNKSVVRKPPIMDRIKRRLLGFYP